MFKLTLKKKKEIIIDLESITKADLRNYLNDCLISLAKEIDSKHYEILYKVTSNPSNYLYTLQRLDPNRLPIGNISTYYKNDLENILLSSPDKYRLKVSNFEVK